jgi:hypothetical protein
MTDPDNDDVFETYLQRRSVLPALGDELEPPAAVDTAVLAKARAAVQTHEVDSRVEVAEKGNPGAGADRAAAEPGRLPTGRPPRWAVPMALAATVLLCLSVVINISLNTNRPSPNRERMAEARADLKASALANATAESNTAAGVDAAASGAARDRVANDREPAESVSGEIASREVVLPRAKVAGAAAPRAPIEVESTAPAQGAADLAPTPSASAAFAAANSGGRVASPAPAPPGAAPGGSAEPADAKAAPGSHEPRVAAADKAVMLAKQAGVAAAEGTPAPEAARAARPADPKVWLKEIEALRTAGKAGLADAEMRRFKAAFPNYAIPAAPPEGGDLPK